VTTAVAVTGVVVIGGGVAGATQFRPPTGHQQEADAEAAHFADAQAAQDIAARNAALGAVNRDAQRPPLVAVTTPTARDPQQVEVFSPGTAMPAAVPSASPSSSASSSSPAVPSSTGSPSTSPSTPKPTTTTTAKPAPSTTTSSTTALGYNATPAQARAIAQQIVPTAQFACFDNIIEHESSWNLHATNASTGAYGLPQSLPGSKMAANGSDWRNNAVTQIKWGLAYMTSRYGSPCAAWAFWQTHHWY